MAAVASCKAVITLEGLNKPLEFPISWSTTTTPTKYVMGRQVTTADTAEALEMGDLATALLVVIECISNDVDIDTSYDSSFHAELTVNEGEAQIFTPAGTVWVKNNDAAEASTFDYLVLGI